MSQMLKSSGALAAATMTSRILGMVREMAYAGFMGVGWVTDAFMMAFMVPNLFRRLLGEGALTASFIPIFKEKEKLAGEAEMWRASNAVISGLVVATAAVVALGAAGVSVALATVNFEGREETRLMLELLRVMSPYVLLVCLAAILMGMCNARGHFFVPAMGATTLNVVMIASVFLLTPLFGRELHERIFGLAVGVLIAGVVQAAFQWPVLRGEGFRYQWVTPWSDDTVRRVVQQMVPGVVGVAAFQINMLITQGIAYFVEKGVVSAFGFAVRLMELPQGVFGLSLATYLLPTLSGLATEKKFPEFRDTLRQGVSYLVFVNLLASVLLVVLAEPIMRLLFERGRFDAVATVRSSQALMCLAPGLVMFSTVNLLVRGFYALGDMKTPMKISIVCLTLNVVLSASLLWEFKERGLGLANTLTVCVNVTLLVFAFRRKMPKLDFGELRRQMPVLLSAAAAAGLMAWGLARLWEARLGHTNLALKLGAVFVPALPACAAYYALAWWCKIPSARDVMELALGKLRRLRPPASRQQ
ncbi:MAG: murein biosynthesis integral membrane protein MurJ [Verrucomicrobia bacterium]|nr:murein biosynthesis integral membrane protein MurJ [Verrucomicrobiota bacterium]